MLPGSRLKTVALVSMVAVSLLVAGPALGESPRHVLGRPAYLVLEAARDSVRGFQWEHDPVAGRRHLRWTLGHLDIPDTLRPVAFGADDLGVLLGPACSGTGAAGRLRFVSGVYRVGEMLELDDGRTRLHLSGGELEISDDQIRYRLPAGKPQRDPRAGYLMLAGMVILVAVLLRRARRRR